MKTYEFRIQDQGQSFPIAIKAESEKEAREAYSRLVERYKETK